MNAANEVAVDGFLNDKISFPGIWDHVSKVMDTHEIVNNPSVDELIQSDKWARDCPLTL